MLKSMMRNEKAEAEYILRHGFTEGFVFGEALSVCKYYRFINGLGDVRIKREIVAFILKHDKTFNEVRNRNTISLLVKRSKKYNLIDKSNPVHITEKELAVIRSIRGFKLQKIALAFLVIAKRDHSKGIVNKTKWNEVKTATSSRVTEDDIYDCMSTLREMGLVDVARKYSRRRESKGYHTLLFVDDDDASPVAITIKSDKEARGAGNLYKQYIGGEVRYCNSCGEGFVANSNKHHYCEKCSNEKRLEKYKRYNKKR